MEEGQTYQMLVPADRPRAVHAAIAQVMDEVGREGIAKGGMADFGGQKRAFRGIDQVYNALNRALVNAKLVIIPSVVDNKVERFEKRSAGYNGGPDKITTTHVYGMTIDYKIVSAIDSSSEVMRIFVEGFDTSDKGTGKAFSYAYKSGVLQLFCIPVEGQDDQDAHDPRIESDAEKRAVNEERRRLDERESAARGGQNAAAAGKANGQAPKREEVKIPLIVGNHPLKGKPISDINSNEERLNYVRGLMHAKEADAKKEGKFQRYWTTQIAEAKTWAFKAWGIKPEEFNVSKKEREIATKSEGVELDICVQPGRNYGKKLDDMDTDQLSKYLGSLGASEKVTHKEARMEAVVMRIAALAEAEAAEKALGGKL